MLKRAFLSVLWPLGGLMAVLAVGLFAPRAAHAVAAALVQVANTTANPVPVQGLGIPTSRIVELYCYKGNASCVSIGPAGTTGNPLSQPTFTVPAGQTFVMTSVDLRGDANGIVQLFVDGKIREEWFLNATNEVEFQFPSGIPIIINSEMHLELQGGAVYMTAHGYLTSN